MFSPIFAPFANPEAIVNNKLALAFLKQGWDIDVITRELPITLGYDYGSTWMEPWLSLKDITHEVNYEAGGIFKRTLETARATVYFKHVVVGCRWAEHAFNLAIKLHKIKQYDIILSRSLPDFGHLPALKMAKVTKLPWIANWNDANGVKNPPPAGKGPHASLGLFHERFLGEVARVASWHTFPSDRMRAHICKYLKNKTEQRSSTIPHVALSDKRGEHERKDDVFTLCYAGNLYAGRNPDLLFKSIRTFLDINPQLNNIKLIIVGLESIGVANLLENYGLKLNVIITGPVSYNETLKYCLSSDVLLVLEAAFTDGIFLPSKFVDYVQCGKPILAISPKNGTLKDIFTKYGGGIAANCTSVSEIKGSLSELYDSWQAGDLDQKYGSGRLYKLFDPKTITELYQGIFDKICSKDRQQI